MKVKQVVTGALVVSSLVLGTVAPALAQDLLKSWLVFKAQKPGDTYRNAHSFWLPELIDGGKFHFESHALFHEFDDDTAHLYGTIVAANGANQKFTFSIWFERSEVGTAGPKKELNSNSYSENGGRVDVATWYYYDFHSTKPSTLTGVAGTEHAGATLNLYNYTDGEYVAQVGVGANGKNEYSGLSVWFGYNGDLQSSPNQHSDINVDLWSYSVPEPTTGLLIPTLVGLGWRSLSKRRNKLKKNNA